jgi:hypothetical protein
MLCPTSNRRFVPQTDLRTLTISKKESLAVVGWALVE